MVGELFAGAMGDRDRSKILYSIEISFFMNGSFQFGYPVIFIVIWCCCLEIAISASFVFNLPRSFW